MPPSGRRATWPAAAAAAGAARRSGCPRPGRRRPASSAPGLSGFLLRRADLHRQVVFLGDFQPQRMSLVIDHQPDVSGVGVLLVFLARAEAAVALPLAFRVEPEQFHFAGRAVDERHGRIVAGSPAGPRTAFEGLQGLPRSVVGVGSGGPRRKLIALPDCSATSGRRSGGRRICRPDRMRVARSAGDRPGRR